MKPKMLALLSTAGMLVSSVAVYSLVPAGGFGAGRATAVAVTEPEAAETAAPAGGDASHFTASGTLDVEGRLGLAKLAADPGSEFVMVEVAAPAGKRGQTAAPVNLAIVIDRSGSMKGVRIQNAIRAATAAVDHLHDGDVVSVVTFDTQVQVVVPPTAVASASRGAIADAIRRITLGGDTCISCGVEQAMALLAQTPGKVSRMIVLSDGDANHGVRDLPGFRAMAQRARDKSVTITTIGVDVEYNEKVLSAIAQESNGHHYFVENAAALSRVFEQEADDLTTTVASDAEASIELPAGVELVRVFDRSFRRVDGRVVVPLGAFAAGDVKTVLLEVRLADKRAEPGPRPFANVELSYQDLATGKAVRATGSLAGVVVASAREASEMDAVVLSRVQRSET
ncbi:MAG TPA: VWA domain-containing protein, partial [Minicystis sp.]|nr:VWA domain-containing protein [Minicystis sp.]